MTSRSVKGLLVAVVVLLALNLFAHWGMSQAPTPRLDRGDVMGMVVDEWRSQYITFYRVHRDGTVEGTRVHRDRLERLPEGTWTAVAVQTAGDKSGVEPVVAPAK